MVRFIDLGKQIAIDETDPDYPRQFAFFDTIYSKFICIGDSYVFDSLSDLLSEMEMDESMTAEFANRLLRLCPNWVTTIKVENPRSSVKVEGLGET